jgi:hypothetical protein
MLAVGKLILGTATGPNALAALGPTLSSAHANQKSGMTAPKPNILF